MNRNTYTEQKERAYSNKWKALQYKGGKCQQCGEDRPATLCFHHRDPSQKELKLDGRSFANRKWETIKEEVDKCDLLCHNCHNILHYGNSWGEFLETLV
jgi:predicted HNH restriction endonuclease